jgi:hypothetical protein
VPPTNCEAKVWWFCVSPEDKSPGTVVIDWVDGGRTVRCHTETLAKGENVWYSENDDRTFFRSTDEHAVLCNMLFENEIATRNVNKSSEIVIQNPRINLLNLKSLIFSKLELVLKRRQIYS